MASSFLSFSNVHFASVRTSLTSKPQSDIKVNFGHNAILDCISSGQIKSMTKTVQVESTYFLHQAAALQHHFLGHSCYYDIVPR